MTGRRMSETKELTTREKAAAILYGDLLISLLFSPISCLFSRGKGEVVN